MTARAVTEAAYLVIGAGVVVLVVWSSRHPDRVAPTGRLLGWMSGSRAARLMLVLFWWWIAWHFFVTPPVLNA
ncbi:DUF6186 family protein [Actinomyces polynesiensis]|uniref:DUF6186 family protein n=1 Tax=Actinomyces polynesiensis TaxID=1325934 RepID=UPI0005B90077|nr:DUF6186 family protein [Actinomyces polynesiensis]